MKHTKLISFGLMLLFVAFLAPSKACAQEVTVTSGIPFSSAIGEGQSSPTTLYLDFYEPAGDTSQMRPLVITVFGGAFLTGSRDYVDMVAYCTRMAQQGFVAASIDYRLLSWLQISHDGIIRDGYMAAQDLSSAIRFLKYHCEEYRIDPDHIFLLGNSAGSIAILGEIFYDESERPQETFNEPDLGPIHSSGYPEYADVSPQVTGAIAQWGGVLSLDVVDAEEYVPLCMIHGTEDVTVPYDSGYCFANYGLSFMPYMYGSHAIAARLDDLGVTDYEFHPFEGEEHCFYLDNSNNLIEEKFNACFDIALNFITRHLDSPGSTSESAQPSVEVCPNPATHSVALHAECLLQDGPYRIQVFDVNGRTWANERVDAPRYDMDVSQWPSGLYLIQFEQGSKRFSQKLLKR